MIKAILACDDLGGVSKAGTMPWPKNSKDLKWFKKNTEATYRHNGINHMGGPVYARPTTKANKRLGNHPRR